MPELPEVETVCQGIKSSLLGSKFVDVILNRLDLRWPLPTDMKRRLNFSRIINVGRRGKFIIIETDNSSSLIVHLGMSGRIIIEKDGINQEDVGAFYHNTSRTKNVLNEAWSKHDHVVFKLIDSKEEEKTFIYNDARRFGAMDLVNSKLILSHKWLKKLGPEPLEKYFSSKYLGEKLSGKSSTIKTVLMDQSVVCGIGNIYASEILWNSGVSPFRPSYTLKRYEIGKIVRETKNVLNSAILKGGSSLKDFRSTSGAIGYFQMHFSVYDRDKKVCKNKSCHNLIRKVTQNGRSSFFCSKCQH